MPLTPAVYAGMLSEKIASHKTRVWLINTGWSGGPYGEGARMKLSFTRAIVTAALSGNLAGEKTWKDPLFGFDIPESCPGVPRKVLNPKMTWKDSSKYDLMSRKLAGMFHENFEKVSQDVPIRVRDAGPRIE